MGLAEMSVTGAMMIVCIIAMRKLIGGRLPKTAFLVLWWCAILRLLMPFAVPASYSAVSLARNCGNDIRNTLAEQRQLWEMQESRQGILQTNTYENMQKGQAEACSVSGTAPQTLISWEETIKYLYCAGVVILAAFFLTGYLRAKRAFAVAVPVKEETVTEWAAGHSIYRKYAVKKLRGLSGPLTYGILKPVILLPETLCLQSATGEITKEELSYILWHEYIHIRRWDTLAKLLLTAVLCLHWWNPMVWWMYVLANRDMELSCDEMVLWKLGERNRAAYANFLIAMEARKGGLEPFYIGFGTKNMEERIYAVMKNKKYTIMTCVLAAIMVLGIAVVFSFSQSTKPNGTAEATFIEYAEDSSNEDSTVAEEEYENLLEKYETFGITEDENGNLFYNGELVRFLLDGYEYKETDGGEGRIARYTYYNGNGTVDVYTVYDDLRQEDGSTELFGELIGIVPYSEEEFAARSKEWRDAKQTICEGNEEIIRVKSYDSGNTTESSAREVMATEQMQ